LININGEILLIKLKDIVFAFFNDISFDFTCIILDLVTVLTDPSAAEIVIDLPLISEVIK
jgi:hypothetical protein